MRLFPIGLACAVCATTAALGAQGDALTVEGSRVNVRANPNTSAPVLLQLERGQRVIEIDRHDAWVNVEIPTFAGREGWIHRSLLTPAAAAPEAAAPQAAAPSPPAPEAAAGPPGGERQPAIPTPPFDEARPMVEVQGNGVNAREGPTTATQVVARFNSGEMLPAVSEQGNWTEVDLGDGRTGWIHDSLLAPVAAPSGPQTAAADAGSAPQPPPAATPPATDGDEADGGEAAGDDEVAAGPEEDGEQEEEQVAAAEEPADGAAARPEAEQVRVLATTVSLRREPSRLAPVVARLQQGDPVSVVGREGAWVEVAVDNGDGAQGWVHGSLVGPPDAEAGVAAAEAPAAANGPAARQPQPPQQQAERGRVEITGRVVNVRREPGTDSPVVAQVNQGRQLAELGREGDWVRVALADDGSGREGWVYGPLVRPVAAPPALARVEPGSAPRTRPGSMEETARPTAAAPPADGAPTAGDGGGAPAATPAPPPGAGGGGARPPAAGPSPAEKAPEGSRMTTAALDPAEVAAMDTEERFDRFKTTVESLNERVRRAAGVDVFAKVEDLGDGTVELTATRAWLAAPEAARRANLDTLFRLWDSVHTPDDAIVVRIVDDMGDVAMEKSR